MKIKATSFRILGYLNSNKGLLIPENQLIRPLRIIERQELVDAIYELKNHQLIGGGKGNVVCKLEGEQYYNHILKQNSELIFDDVFEDYDYALLKFLHFNDWGPWAEEFPQILKSKCPEDIFEDYLYQQRIFIEEKNRSYFLTPEGEERYHLETRRHERMRLKHEAKIINIHGDNTFLAENSNFLDKVKVKPTKANNLNSQKRKWLEILAPVAGVIGKFVGF